MKLGEEHAGSSKFFICLFCFVPIILKWFWFYFFIFFENKVAHPKYVFAVKGAPEKHHPFVIHYFGDMMCKDYVRAVWEVGISAFVGDIAEGIYKAWIPKKSPAGYQGRMICIRVPSIPFEMRDATQTSDRAEITCPISNSKRNEEVR